MSSPLTPAPGRPLGLADLGGAALAGPVTASWDAFLDLAAACDLDAPSRLPGWTGRDVCVHLGDWPDSHPLASVLASARGGGSGAATDPGPGNDRIVAAHRGASADEVLAALVRARDATEEFLESGEADDVGRVLSASAVGPMPVLGLVHAACYELAVHALDLVPAGAPDPSQELLREGLAAVIDVTGALADRQGLAATVTGHTPGGGWRFVSRPDGGSGWRTEPVGPGPVEGTAVLAEASVLLDVSAGRLAVPPLLVDRRLRVQEMRSFLRLAPLIEGVPGVPGGATLRLAASTVSRAGSLLTRLTGRR